MKILTNDLHGKIPQKIMDAIKLPSELTPSEKMQLIRDMGIDLNKLYHKYLTETDENLLTFEEFVEQRIGE